MQFSISRLLALTITASQVSAKTITVEVGQDGLSFAPDNIKAAEGDTVEFHFDSSHSVNSGPFAKPCSPSTEGGFGSGPLPNGDNSWFSVTVNNTKPIWFYCGVPGHCQAGMVGVINAGTDKTLSAYKSAAAETDKTTTPPKPFGGIISAKSGGGTSSGSSTTESQGTGTATGSSTAQTTDSKDDAGRASRSLAGVLALSFVVAGVLA